MSAPHLPKVAGINSPFPPSPHTAAALSARAAGPDSLQAPGGTPQHPGGPAQDGAAGRLSDLTTLHELTERLAATRSLDAALDELLTTGAALIGARRGMAVLEPPGAPPDRAGRPAPVRRSVRTCGLGFTHAELGCIETVPRALTTYGRVLEAAGAGAGAEGGEGDGGGRVQHSAGPAAGAATMTEPAGAVERSGSAGPPGAAACPDLLHDPAVDPREREVAVRLGYAASHTQPLVSTGTGPLGVAVWMYDEPGAPGEWPRQLLSLYARSATGHLARLAELEQARESVTALAEELLPSRLPRVPGVRLAVRRRGGSHCGGDWYDALPLPEGALGLAVGSVGGSGPSALAAMGRLRTSLRAYAVMEGEDPVAVLSDLELLLRLTEPARTATALFAHVEPTAGKIVLAGAGHAPPLVTGERRTEFVETSLSAPLGMLACWEAPSVELCPEPGETVLLYTDGLLRRTGDPMDRAFARLHAAAASVPRAARSDPGAVADHVLNTLFREGPPDRGAADEDVVLLAARFD